MPPAPVDDVLPAASALVQELRNAGWTPTSRGSDWYAQRFVWAGEQDPQPLA